MKKLKNYFVSLVVLLLFVLGCSTPENSDEKNTVKSEAVSKTINFDPALVLNSVNNVQQSDNQRSLPYIYTVKEYIFLRPNGASGLGHVGVGFHLLVTQGHNLIIQNMYFVGAVENGNGTSNVRPGQNNGGWVGSTENRLNMLGYMVSLGYTEYKVKNNFREVSYDQCNNAVNKMLGFSSRGYSVLGNNCMNACWDTLWELRTPNLARVDYRTVWNFPPRLWFFNNNNGWIKFVRPS